MAETHGHIVTWRLCHVVTCEVGRPIGHVVTWGAPLVTWMRGARVGRVWGARGARTGRVWGARGARTGRVWGACGARVWGARRTKWLSSA
eukprot:544297-Prymnesium_polylepis.1